MKQWWIVMILYAQLFICAWNVSNEMNQKISIVKSMNHVYSEVIDFNLNSIVKIYKSYKLYLTKS